MGNKTLLFGLSCILLAYYTYIPIPENMEEPWKVRLIDILTKIATLTVIYFSGKLGGLVTNIYMKCIESVF